MPRGLLGLLVSVWTTTCLPLDDMAVSLAGFETAGYAEEAAEGERISQVNMRPTHLMASRTTDFELRNT